MTAPDRVATGPLPCSATRSTETLPVRFSVPGPWKSRGSHRQVPLAGNGDDGVIGFPVDTCRSDPDVPPAVRALNFAVRAICAGPADGATGWGYPPIGGRHGRRGGHRAPHVAHAVVVSVLTPAEILIPGGSPEHDRTWLSSLASCIPRICGNCAAMSSPVSTSTLMAGISAAAGSVWSSGPRRGLGSCGAGRRSPGGSSPPRSHRANAAARADPVEPRRDRREHQSAALRDDRELYGLSRARSIVGGTAEIQTQIIAQPRREQTLGRLRRCCT
jgi:hypothetical protein